MNRSGRWILVGAIVAGIVLAAEPAAAGTQKLRGSVTLAVAYKLTSKMIGDVCDDTNFEADIVRGTQVRVRDAKGKTVGVAPLGVGHVVLYEDSNLRCQFRFSTKIPDSSSVYSVRVAHRPASTYTRDQLQRDGWRVGIKLTHPQSLD
jgi:hypothetical protein